MGEGTRAVAELVLDQRAQLAESLVIFGDQEERVITEARRAPRLADDPPAAGGYGFEPDPARRIGHGQAQRNAAPRLSSGTAEIASTSLRLFAASSHGSPA